MVCNIKQTEPLDLERLRTLCNMSFEAQRGEKNYSSNHASPCLLVPCAGHFTPDKRDLVFIVQATGWSLG